MLSQKNRISRKDFPAFKRQGFRVFSELFSGTVYPTDDKKIRVSVVVSKKTAKLAVVRNHLRRVFYEAIKPYLESFTQGSLVVLYPKSGAVQVSFVVLKSEIEKELKRIKVLK